MNPLEQSIIDRIKQKGAITIETFMDMALYHPGLGYYSSPATTIGRDGDFYTSPHLHPVFGAMIGKQLIEMWKVMGMPPEFHAVEMGAGAGYLCSDIFHYLFVASEDTSLLREKIGFLDSLQYVIVEPYAHFQDTQRKLIEHSLENPLAAGNMPRRRKPVISWVTSLSELNGIGGCIFSNELLDAFPVHLVEMHDCLKEVYVSYADGKFEEILENVSEEDIIHYFNPSRIGLEPGCRTEINLQVKKWLSEVSSALSRGFILTIDYGYTAREYYSSERSRGTLLCYHKHLFNENPYQHIGEQDITAHVNFSALKMWGEEHGIKTLGYCPQGTFLVAAGIDEVITELYSDSADYFSEISKIKGLIVPQGMGESHRFMVQYKGDGLPELRGFSMRNLAGAL